MTTSTRTRLYPDRTKAVLNIRFGTNALLNLGYQMYASTTDKHPPFVDHNKLPTEILCWGNVENPRSLPSQGKIHSIYLRFKDKVRTSSFKGMIAVFC
jgi:hypothetical protein